MNSPTAIKPSIQSSSKPKTHLISLNIGGETFTTTIETLTQGYAANSMLATLASTTLPTTRDKSGMIFIDRDGARFRVILNFLRCGTVHVVDGRVPCPGGGFLALDELEEEARFYSIAALGRAIKEEVSRLELEQFLESLEPQRRYSPHRSTRLHLKTQSVCALHLSSDPTEPGASGMVMMLRAFLLALTLTACLRLAVAWRRIGLGRAIWAHSNQSNLILLSETATLASLDLRTGDIQWRIPYPSLSSSVSPRAVLHHGELVILALSNERVQAVRANGDVIWELPGCGIAFPPEENLFPIQMCDSEDYVYANSTGEVIDAVQRESRPVLTLNPGPAALSWSSDGITVVSESDGLLRALEEDKVLWEREEGLSHPSQGAIYVYETKSVLVLLSELGAIFGLDSNDGNIVWKLKTEGDCKLYSGHKTIAVLTCTVNVGSTTALAIDTTSGEVVQRDSIEHYTATKGALEDTHKSIPSLRLVSMEGEERTLLAEESSTSKELYDRPWLFSSQQESFIAAHQNGSNIWIVPIPSSSKIVALAKPQPLHPFASRVRPPAVRVTGDRRLLHKYIDPNIALVLAYDEKAGETHAILIDTYTGAIHDVVTHPETALPASAVKGESWFVYSLWNKISMQQELHIIDMYHPEKNGSWVWQAMSSVVSKSLGLETMDMLGKLTGKEPGQCPIGESAQSVTQCSPDTVPANSMSHTIPYVVRSSTLLTQRVRSLEVTQTLMGLTEPAIVLTLESGQVTLVSKFLLDARRPKETNDAYEDEHLLQYQPMTSLRSHSRDSLFVDGGKHIPRFKFIAVAPHHIKESICQIAVLGADLVYSLEHPAGEFDSLPDDFVYSGVVGMILALIAAYLYTQDLNVKTSLAKSWNCSA